jgi:hypothetical protein
MGAGIGVVGVDEDAATAPGAMIVAGVDEDAATAPGAMIAWGLGPEVVATVTGGAEPGAMGVRPSGEDTGVVEHVGHLGQLFSLFLDASSSLEGTAPSRTATRSSIDA